MPRMLLRKVLSTLSSYEADYQLDASNALKLGLYISEILKGQIWADRTHIDHLCTLRHDLLAGVVDQYVEFAILFEMLVDIGFTVVRNHQIERQTKTLRAIRFDSLFGVLGTDSKAR